MLVRPGNVPKVDHKFDAMVVWMAEEPLVPGKQYLFKQTSKVAPGAVSTLRYRVDVNTLHRQPAPTLALNEIGRCGLTFSQPIIYDGYRQNRSTGNFIVIDRMTNNTVGAGMILDRASDHGKRPAWDEAPTSEHLTASGGQVTAEERAARFGQRPVTILLTGLTGSGKTTIGYALERRLFETGRVATMIDGQNLRLGLNRDLGFSDHERSENLRRTMEVARLFNRAGLVCIAAFVAPTEELREKARDLAGAEQFLLVHMDTPIEVCRQRDRRGMYAKADAGELQHFPGVSAPYEPPKSADITLQTASMSIEACVDEIIRVLVERKFID